MRIVSTTQFTKAARLAHVRFRSTLASHFPSSTFVTTATVARSMLSAESRLASSFVVTAVRNMTRVVMWRVSSEKVLFSRRGGVRRKIYPKSKDLMKFHMEYISLIYDMISLCLMIARATVSTTRYGTSRRIARDADDAPPRHACGTGRLCQLSAITR